MTVPTTIDPGALLSKHLTGEDGDGDLARALLAAFAEHLGPDGCARHVKVRGSIPWRPTGLWDS